MAKFRPKWGKKRRVKQKWEVPIQWGIAFYEEFVDMNPRDGGRIFKVRRGGMCLQVVIELVQEAYQRGIERGVIGKASADPICPYCGHVDTTWSRDIVGDQPAVDDFLQYVCAACGKEYKLYPTQRIEFASQKTKVYVNDQINRRALARAEELIAKHSKRWDRKLVDSV